MCGACGIFRGDNNKKFNRTKTVKVHMDVTMRRFRVTVISVGKQ